MKEEKQIGSIARLVYLMLGGVFLIVGIIGVLIPVIPGFIFLAKVYPGLKKYARFGKRNN